jgi:hypothetical protein
MPIISAFYSLLCAFGLAWIAAAFYASRAENPVAQYLFWIGIISLLLPAMIRLASRNASRLERLRLLLILTIALSLVKVFYSPIFFTFFDELQHWRTANDLLRTGHLFNENPILFVSPYFPGLELVTHALISLSGLSIYQAGILVIGLSRLLLVLALFLCYELISGSSRLAGIATLFYLGNPHFLLFDAQFGYESFALPLTAFTLYGAARLEYARPVERNGLMLFLVLGMGVIIVTHHVTSFLLVGLFFLWSGVAWLRREPVLKRFVPFWIGAIGMLGIILWLVFVANRSLDYLTPPLTNAIHELVQLISGERSPRQLFTSSSEERELFGFLRFSSITAILVILISLPFGLMKIWQNYRRNSPVLVLALIAATYPLTLALRYVPWGLTVASRTAPYVFVGIGFVLAAGFDSLRWQEQKLRLAFSSWALVIFLGIIASNLAAWDLPRNHRIDSYTHSVDNLSTSAARWIYTALGPSNRLAGEDPLLWVMAAYGAQRAVTPDADRIWFDEIYTTPGLSDGKLRTLRSAHVRYLLLDRRRGSQLLIQRSTLRVRTGNGFEMKRIDIPSALSEFDRMNNASRILDNGAIILYDLTNLYHGK